MPPAPGPTDVAIDWALEDETDPSITAQDGALDPRTLTHTTRTYAIVARWLVIDPNEHGLYTWLQITEQRKTEATGDPSDSTEPVAAESGEDHAARVAQEQADREAAEKEQRRRVLKLNKLALAAQQVRRDKLREVLGRKTLPKGKAADVAAFVAMTLWNHHTLLAQTANRRQCPTDRGRAARHRAVARARRGPAPNTATSSTWRSCSARTKRT